MARWLRGGSHRLSRWETDWSSQTGACQAGLLHGNNDDMPAFRWWEKDRGAAIVTNHPRDAAELERRHSDGRGLLFADGASRANILSGDAPHSLLTMSTVPAPRAPRPHRPGLLRLLRQPLQRHAHVRARDPREIVQRALAAPPASGAWTCARGSHAQRGYALVRAWATIDPARPAGASVISDMYAGRPVIYTTFLAYDEVAHHSGIERPDALATLRRLWTARSGGSRRRPRHAPPLPSWSCSPTTASRRARPSSTATGSRWRRSSSGR